MSMLADPKRKQKWMLSSRGKQWSEDSNKFGQKIMEKMGWSTGKGLGAQEQGIVDHIRVKVKNDQVGIGYNIHRDNHWSAYQESFNHFLQDLQKEKSVNNGEIMEEKYKVLSTKSLDNAEMIEGNDQVSNRKSLEEKSKQSQKRVHYRKFVRGKDVNKYSPKDLANIFGKKNLNEKYTKEENEEDVTTKNEMYDPVGTTSSTHGIVTIKAGNMNDYFKSKTVHTTENSWTSKKNNDIYNDTEKNTELGSSLKNKSKFYLNNIALSPGNDDSESESERYTGFGFSKTKKVNNLNYVFDNPCLDLNILDTNSPIPKKIKSEISGTCTDKIIQKKRKNESTERESLECSSKSSTKKRKTEFIYENKGLDLEFLDNSTLSKEDTSESLLNKYEASVSNLELSNKINPKKQKKTKRKSLTNENDDLLHTEFLQKSVPKQSEQSESKLSSSGYDNFGLDLEFSNRLIPKKPKRNKNKPLLVGNKNDALNVEFLDKSILKESEQNNNCELNTEISNPPTPKNIKKIKNEVVSSGYENFGLDIKSSNNSVSNKIKKDREFEDISNVYENLGLDLDYSDKISTKKKKTEKNLETINKLTPTKTKKCKKSKILSMGIENPVSDSEIVETPKETRKCKDTDTLSNVFENLALDLNDSANKIPVTSDFSFEVPRTKIGMENSALDLSDENSNKKRVTFNAQVEYSSDTPKKKKKKKKLDKYEVANEKCKMIKKTMECVAFVNEAMDEEVPNKEEVDNELNERKSKKCKRKKERRISLLETIDEFPEEENLNETSIIVEKADKRDNKKKVEFKDKLNETMIEDLQEITTERSYKKKKKKENVKEKLTNLNESEEINVTEGQMVIMNTSAEATNKIKKIMKKARKAESVESLEIPRELDYIGNENVCSYDEEINKTDCIKDENIKMSSNHDILESEHKKNEGTNTNLKTDSEFCVTNETETNNAFHYNNSRFKNRQRMKKSKEMIKSMFKKNPILMFNGSNINEIKGYAYY